MTGVGYPDGQRVQNFTGPELFAENAIALPAQVQSGALDVSRYAYISGFIQAQNNIPIAVTLAWYADQNLTILIALRRFVVSGSIPNPAQLKIANLGPWCQASFAPIGGTSQLSCGLWGSNIPSPLEFTPTNAQLISKSNVTTGPGVGTFYYPTDYYAGPIRVWLYGSGTGVNWTMAVINTDGTQSTVDQSQNAVNGEISMSTVAPPGAWNMEVETVGSGNTTFYFAVTPSATGSL